MMRKLRVEYPGAIYHVMNRGNRREVIFLDDADRQALRVDPYTARRHLRQDMKIPSNVGRAHHNIPIEHRNKPLVQKAAEGGFDFNNAADNGTALRPDFHNGYPDWHRKYNDAAGEDLDRLGKAFPNLTAEQAAELMRQYSAALRDLIDQAKLCQ